MMRKLSWTVAILLVFPLVLVAFTNNSWAKNPDVSPRVSITSPQNGAKVYEDLLNVVVSFGPKEKGKGNVRTIKLKLDGTLVATHDNPAQIKEGTYTFALDITNLPDSEHTLQAFAYQAEERAMLEGSSEIVTFTFLSITRQITKMEGSLISGSWEDLTMAAETLKTIGKPAVPKLLIAFKDSSKNEILRKMYLEILAAIKDRSAVEPLIQVLQSGTETEFVRAEVAFALGEIGDRAATQPLIQSLSDESKQIRTSAALGLGYIGNTDAVPLLIEKLSDSSVDVKIGVIRALGLLNDPRAVEPLMGLLNDESETIACAAILALGFLKDNRAVDPLLNILQTGTTGKQIHAMESLGEIGDPRAVEPLIAFLENEDEYLVMESGSALAQIRDQRAAKPIRMAIERVTDEFIKTELKEAYKTLTGEEY